MSDIIHVVMHGAAAVKNTATGIGSNVKDVNSIGHGLVGAGAGLAMVGAAGVGAGQGVAAGRAAEAVGRNPEAESKIRSMVILGLGIAESAAIYALIVSILLLFVY